MSQDYMGDKRGGWVSSQKMCTLRSLCGLQITHMAQNKIVQQKHTGSKKHDLHMCGIGTGQSDPKHRSFTLQMSTSSPNKTSTGT